MKNNTRFAAGRRFDVICLGRFAVDFYAQQIGARLEDVASFAKYLGGSSANTAFGCARLGLSTAMAARVGDDAMGRFLTETLAREGCDVSHVSIDPTRLTACVVLGIKDRDTFPLIFYRENCADMAVTEDDVAEDFLAQSKALLITGTHFSTAHVHRVSTTALERARRNGVRTVLDIDYRPVLWGLTKRGDGETRFIANDAVTAHLQAILPLFDLVIGTMEEFAIAGGSTDIIAALTAVRTVTPATLVVKRGPMGCAVIDGPIPRSLDDAFNGQRRRGRGAERAGRGRRLLGGLPVRLGARRELRRLLPLRQCLRRAGRVAARVRAGDAHPRRARPLPRQRREHSASRSRRCADAPAPQDRAARAAARALHFCVRPPRSAVRSRPGHGRQRKPAAGAEEALRRRRRADGERRGASPGASGCCATTGTARTRSTRRPAAAGGSGGRSNGPAPIRSCSSTGARSARRCIGWPVEQVVKCLVPFHPDDDVDNRLENEAQVKALYDAVQVSGHELLLEIVPPKRLPPGPDVLLRAMKRLYNLGIYPEWWKLPPPSAGEWPAIDALVAERDPWCRGIVLLGLSAPIDDARPRLRRRGGQPQLPGLRRRTDDLPRAGARVARRRDR